MASHQESAVSIEALRAIAADHGFTMKPEDEPGYLALTQAIKESVDYVFQLPDYVDPGLTPDLGLNRDGVRAYAKPSPAENPLNAWMYRTHIQATKPTSALLSGKTMAIKDNAAVAGVPLTLGTQPHHLHNTNNIHQNPHAYPIPLLDAVVVSRALAAGALITGTATCENYCMSARSSTSATGPVHNPWRRGYDAGGSSSGSAALVGSSVVRRWRAARGLSPLDEDLALGEGVDLALGGDQGGSIRIPASHCGVYGMKPTRGLVPYTGLASLHPMLDHAGPIAGSVRDTALLLSALAGYDGFDDARMTPETPLRQNVLMYHERLDAAISERQDAGSWNAEGAARGLRIGVLREAFEIPGLEPDVEAVVRRAASRFSSLGAATVVDVSVPAHAETAHRLFAAAAFGHMPESMIYASAPAGLSFPCPFNNNDSSSDTAEKDKAEGDAGTKKKLLTQKWYDTMTRSNPMVPSVLFSGEYIQDKNHYPAAVRDKALRHVHELRAAYDRALRENEVDVLVMPATLTVGVRHSASEKMGVQEKGEFVLVNSRNTEPFNLTGHPAFVVPVGWGRVDGGHGDGDAKLPVGMQIVGRRWDEETLFLAAAVWEVGGWGLDEE